VLSSKPLLTRGLTGSSSHRHGGMAISFPLVQLYFHVFALTQVQTYLASSVLLRSWVRLVPNHASARRDMRNGLHRDRISSSALGSGVLQGFQMVTSGVTYYILTKHFLRYIA
jgi:hypothetical protein